MANVIITADSNHDDLTTRGAGQNITINNGAILTIDSYPQETAMGLLGQIVTNDGIWRIDGRQVKEFAYTSGSGTLPSIGDIITDSGGASGKVIYLNSGTSTSGVMTVTQQSGSFSASNTLSSGSFSATLSSVKVGYLLFFMEDGNNSGKGLGTLDFVGEWYELGTGDGTDGQTFTLPHNGTQQAIWVETGSGTGIYERWIRKDSTTAFTDYQTDELGKVFDHTINSNTVTFGTSANGNTPPSGAKLRIPNVHLGTATIALPTTEVDADISGNSMWNVGVNSSLVLSSDKVNFSTVNNQFTGLDSITIKNSCIAVMNSAISNLTVGVTTIENSVILGSRDFNGTEGTNIAFTDLSGVNITDSFLGSYKDFPVNFNTSSNITLIRVTLNGMDPTHSNNNRRLKFTNCATVTATDVIGIRIELLFEVGTIDVNFTNYSFSDGESSILYSSNENGAIFIQTGASNILFDGISLITNGSPVRKDFVEFNDAINCIIRNVGDINSKIDFQNHTDFLATFGGVSSGCKLQRVYVENTRNTRLIDYVVTTLNCEITNCSSSYNKGLIPDSKATIVQGLHGASGNLNTVQGLEIDYPLTAGVHGLDVFTSDTEGRVHVLFTPPTSETSQYVTLTGGAVYNKEGDLLLRTLGDSGTIEVPYLIKGHDTLVNTSPTINGSVTGNIDVEYSIDTGSGYGAFKSATGLNLNGETISPNGFKIKFKFTANASNNSTLINGFFIETTTTLTDQSNNFYPFARPLVGFNLTQTNSKIAIFNDSTENLVASGAEDGSGLTVAEVAWEANFSAIQRLRLPGFASIESLVTVVENGSVQPGVQSTYPLIGSSDPGLTSNITITNHGASPVSWDAGNGVKDYSITIQTDATGDNFTAEQLLNEINYSIAQTATYFGFNGFAWPEMLIQAGTTVETARGRLFGSAGANLKGVRVIKSDGSTAHPAISRFQADDGTYAQGLSGLTILAPNILQGSKVQIKNTTTNSVRSVGTVGTGGVNVVLISGTDYTTGDNIRVRISYQSGAVAKNEIEYNIVAPSVDTTNQNPVSQTDHPAYTDYAVDGSNVTGIQWDSTNMQFDFNESDDIIEGADIGAWYYYFITTTTGIDEAFGVLNWSQINRLEFQPVLFDNVSSDPLQINNAWIDRVDGVSIIDPNSNSIQINPPAVFVVDGGGSGGGFTSSDRTKLNNIYTDTQRVDGLIEDDSGDQFTTKALSQAPSGGGGTNVNVVSVGGNSVSSPDDLKADVTNLDVAVSTRSTLTAADVWSNATRTLTSFGTLISDIWSNVSRTLTGAVETDTASREASKADVSALALETSVQTLPTAAEIDAELTTNHGTGPWQTAAIPGSIDANIVAVNGTGVSNIDEFKANVSALALESTLLNRPTLAEIEASTILAKKADIYPLY